MIDFEPKYITFDCYGTLTKFRMADMAREMYGDRLKGADATVVDAKSVPGLGNLPPQPQPPPTPPPQPQPQPAETQPQVEPDGPPQPRGTNDLH